MSYRQPITQSAPNYTGAFLATMWLLLFMAFFTLGALYGMVAVLVLAFGLDRLLIAWWRRLRARDDLGRGP